MYKSEVKTKEWVFRFSNIIIFIYGFMQLNRGKNVNKLWITEYLEK